MNDLFPDVTALAPPLAWAECLRLTIPGRPEQRGSKVPIVLYDKRTKLPRLNASGKVMLFAKDDNPRSESYMKKVNRIGAAAWGQRALLNCPIALSAVFHFARFKKHFYETKARNGEMREDAPVYHAQSPDLAKLFRCVEDGLTGAVWFDDKLVCEYLEPSRRVWAVDGQERTELVIYIPAGTVVTNW